MSWNYQEYSHGHLPPVMENIKDKLNSMDRTEAASAKIATADERGGAARGVVFWNSDDPATPPEIPNGTWDHDVQQGHDYNALYEWAKTKLESLTEEQAYYAKVVYGDAKYNSAKIAVYWIA